MCSGTPGKVLRVKFPEALVETQDGAMTVLALAQDDVCVGDFVLIYAGMIVRMISEQDSLELQQTQNELRLLQQEYFNSAQLPGTNVELES